MAARKIGLIDVDGRKFPNLPLMKLSAWHKAQGDHVEWYDPMFSGHMDKVYLSKVFSSSPDFPYFIDADEVVQGGSGYCIRLENGREFYDKTKEAELPWEIEHIYPDYSLYGITDTAYGFLTRGCPVGCPFCVVAEKEGRRSVKVADLSEWWDGQRNIVLMDPNILGYKGHMDLLGQLRESKAKIDINQGLDARLLTEENIQAINGLRLKEIHFAWDLTKNEKAIIRGLELYKSLATRKPHGAYGTVYVLVNYDTTMEENLHRIYTLRDMGYDPYVMVYNKPNAPKEIKQLQRWCNNRIIFKKCPRFEEYNPRRG